MQPRQNRYARKNSQGGQSSIYTPAPEYDDPANCAEEDQYVSLNLLLDSVTRNTDFASISFLFISDDILELTLREVHCTVVQDLNMMIQLIVHQKMINTVHNMEVVANSL